jgi:hypothetical protein
MSSQVVAGHRKTGAEAWARRRASASSALDRRPRRGCVQDRVAGPAAAGTPAAEAPKRWPHAPGCRRACTRSRALGEQGVDRHRHDARLDGAQKRRRKIDRVVQAQQHALLDAEAQAAQHVGARRCCADRARVRAGTGVVDEGDFGRGRPQIAFDQVVRRVELRGTGSCGGRRWRTHLLLRGRRLLNSGMALMPSIECGAASCGPDARQQRAGHGVRNRINFRQDLA